MTIEPDIKDWTWVLDRPCPDCGYDSSAFDREDVGEMVRVNARAWHTVLQRDDVRGRPDDTTWSPLEYACHVRDVFRLYDERLLLMLNEDNPLFPNWDQDATAVEQRYDEQDPSLVADELTRAATQIASRFDGLPADAWTRRGRRSDGASFTIESFARYFTHDWVHHLHDVEG